MPTYRHILKSRYAVLGAIVIAVLGLLLLRLWTMQVLSGPAFASQAEENRIREITTEAPRGRILDRNGKELVTNRPTLAVVVAPTVRDDAKVLNSLSALLDIPETEIVERLSSVKEAALAPRAVAIDVPMETVAYLVEHESEFPGVEIQEHAVREYPQGKLAAHVIGYTGELSEADLATADFEGYHPTDVVGKAGAERSFESVLQGDRGRKLIEVDAAGRPRRVIEEIDPVPGRDVVLTIDSDVQKIAEKALQDAFADARKDDYDNAKAGAAVVLDTRTGEVIAMASAPTYDPTVFLGGISNDEWRSLTTTGSEFPLTNRGIMAQYPPASTFKAVTGMAGLTYDMTGAYTAFDCEGGWTGMGEQWKKYCWKRTGHGMESFVEGIEDSCDTVFYEIGYKFYKDKGEKFQKYARTFGYGQLSGIDLPGEADGRVPDAAWKKKYNEDYPEYQRWLPGDTVNMAIGQGDVLATPLQVAASYAGIANGGKLMRPHVMKEVLGSDGEAVRSVEPEVAFAPKMNKNDLAVMRGALRRVVTSGTGEGAFRGFPVEVAGKTGTAQVTGKDDYAWFVGYAPASKPQYVVAVVIEQGGHGGSVAGPAARQILAAALGEEIEHVRAQDESR